MAGVQSAHLWGRLDVLRVHATQSCPQPAPSPVHSWVIWGEIYGAPQRDRTQLATVIHMPCNTPCIGILPFPPNVHIPLWLL